MLENIGNAITHLPMDHWDETWLVASHHVADMSAIMRLPWQRPLPCNGALDIQQLWASDLFAITKFLFVSILENI